MADPLAEMALSEDWAERVRAARLLARNSAGDKETLVLRLLRDPASSTVSEAMVTSLLEARREGAIRLILRSLGQPDGAPPDERDQCLLEGLLTSELDGVDVRGSIVSVLLETHARDELLGALAAIAWLAPSGGFAAPPRALEHVSELAQDSNVAIREAARRALAALGDWQQRELET